MITPDGSSIRIIGPEVSDEAVRQAVLDEDGHIRELPASEWRKFEWDSVVKFMHNYPVYVLPTTELLDALTACRRFKPDCVLGCNVTHLWREGMQSGNMYGVDFERLLPQLKRLILVGNLRTHAGNLIMAIDHMEIDLQGDLITRSDEPELNRVFVWDNP